MDTKVNRKDFNGFSFDFEELESVLAELIDSCFDISEHDMDSPLNISFTVKMNSQGFPKIQSFGKTTIGIPKTQSNINPISKIEEDEVGYIITLDLLGHEKEDIEAVLEKDSLVVMSRKNRPFYKKFFLSKPVVSQEVRKSFKNNVLEIILKKSAEIR